MDLPVELEIPLSSSDDDIHDNNTLLVSEKLQKVLNHEEIESRERDFGETKNYRF